MLLAWRGFFFYTSSAPFGGTFSCAHPSVRTGAPSRGRLEGLPRATFSCVHPSVRTGVPSGEGFLFPRGEVSRYCPHWESFCALGGRRIDVFIVLYTVGRKVV